MCHLTTCSFTFKSGKGFHEHFISCHADQPLHWPVLQGAKNLIDEHPDEQDEGTIQPNEIEEQHGNEKNSVEELILTHSSISSTVRKRRATNHSLKLKKVKPMFPVGENIKFKIEEGHHGTAIVNKKSDHAMGVC